MALLLVVFVDVRLMVVGGKGAFLVVGGMTAGVHSTGGSLILDG